VTVAPESAVRRATLPVRRLEPTAGRVWPRLCEAWEHRELLYFFVLRDLKVKYAQTLLGWLWSIAQPLGLMLVFTFAFRALADIKTGAVPYPLFVLAGLTFWLFFSRALMNGAESLVSNAALLTKTAAPRILIPVAGVVSALVELVPMFAMLVVFELAYGWAPGWRILLAPLVVAVGLALALGISLLLSALNVRHRDVRNVLPLFLQLWLFLSPIAYPLSTLDSEWRSIFALNPLVGIVEAFRWTVTGEFPPSQLALWTACAISAAMLGTGLFVFARAQRFFADVV
jgi:lipopolysaccharide transport system permease protein